MSFIGNLKKRAKTLNELQLTVSEAQNAYNEVCQMMTKMYREAKVVHGKLSSDHILWCDKKYWFINLSSAVDSKDPSAKEKLRKDCFRVTEFFREQRAEVIDSEKLFQKIISHKLRKT